MFFFHLLPHLVYLYFFGCGVDGGDEAAESEVYEDMEDWFEGDGLMPPLLLLLLVTTCLFTRRRRMRREGVRDRDYHRREQRKMEQRETGRRIESNRSRERHRQSDRKTEIGKREGEKKGERYI